MPKKPWQDTLWKKVARGVLPAGIVIAGKRLVLSRQARRLVSLCRRQPDLPHVVDVVLESQHFAPEQKRSEILALLNRLQALKPRRICEIGGRAGGSLALFAQVAAPDARLLSIDLDYTRAQARALPVLATEQQQIVCLKADSHESATVTRLAKWLASERLDFLFIDGDHSWAGVAADFAAYSGFVRPGGIVALHDIVPDSMTRFGVRTDADVGQVPAFWAELKQRGLCEVEELVDDPMQDGYGIGVMYWSG